MLVAEDLLIEAQHSVAAVIDDDERDGQALLHVGCELTQGKHRAAITAHRERAHPRGSRAHRRGQREAERAPTHGVDEPPRARLHCVAARPVSRDAHVSDDDAVGGPELDSLDELHCICRALVSGDAGADHLTEGYVVPGIAVHIAEGGFERAECFDEIGLEEHVPGNSAWQLTAEADCRATLRHRHLPVLGVHRVEAGPDNQKEVSTPDE